MARVGAAYASLAFLLGSAMGGRTAEPAGITECRRVPVHLNDLAEFVDKGPPDRIDRVDPFDAQRSDQARAEMDGVARQGAEVRQKAFTRLQMKPHHIFYASQVTNSRLIDMRFRSKVEACAPDVSQCAEYGAGRAWKIGSRRQVFEEVGVIQGGANSGFNALARCGVQ